VKPSNLVNTGCHYISAQVWRTEHKHFVLASKGADAGKFNYFDGLLFKVPMKQKITAANLNDS